MRVVVVGGGPSGLVTLKFLQHAHQFFPIKPIEVKLFEGCSQVGGVFYHHSYEDGELVSSKYLTTFSDFRPRNGEPDFMSTGRYLEYLQEYCTHFELWPNINLETKVVRVRRGQASGHIVTYRSKDGKETDWDCDAVAVCSGLHDKPYVPDLPGVEAVPTVMHSSEFKARKQFGQNKTVVVVGSGETGADLAHLAITSPTKHVVLCHKDGILTAPKRMPTPLVLPRIFRSLGGDPHGTAIPTDVAQASLFDTMYVHPLLRDSMFLWDMYNATQIKSTPFIATGGELSWDQYVGAVSPERLHASKLFFNKAWNRVGPYLSPPWRPRPGMASWTWARWFRSLFLDCPLPDGGRYVDLATWPTHVDAEGRIHFHDNGSPEYEVIKAKVIKPDMLVWATGYVPSFPFLQADKVPIGYAKPKGVANGHANGHTNGHAVRTAVASPTDYTHKPYPTNATCNVRSIWARNDPTVGFIGFVRPGFGAIPPLAEMQAMLWTQQLLGRLPAPLDRADEWHYRMHAGPETRVACGVDHEAYVYQLACDMGCAPGLGEVVRLSWRAAGEMEMREWGSGFPARRAWARRARGAAKVLITWGCGTQFVTKYRMVGPWAFRGSVEIVMGELWETIARRRGVFGNFMLSFVPIFILGLANLAVLLYVGAANKLAALGLRRRIEKGDWLPPDKRMGYFEETMT